MEQYRKSPRACFLDYDQGDFFITICTTGRKHFFGEITDGEMHLNSLGKFVESQLSEANQFCPDLQIPLFVVMPNHIHAVIQIVGKELLNQSDSDLLQRSPNPSERANPNLTRHIPTLSKYIASFKGAVTKHAKALGIDFGWQTRYHDHLIRGSFDGNRIAEYIQNNPARWEKDCFY